MYAINPYILVNYDNTIGACGFTSMIAPFMYPVTLIKVDGENKIMRDRTGVCIKAKPGKNNHVCVMGLKHFPTIIFYRKINSIS